MWKMRLALGLNKKMPVQYWRRPDHRKELLDFMAAIREFLAGTVPTVGSLSYFHYDHGSRRAEQEFADGAFSERSVELCGVKVPLLTSMALFWY